MKINQAAVDLVKQFEGFRGEAYLDKLANPPVWTIGYGTTANAGVGIAPKAGTIITEAQAEEYLHRGLEKFAAQIAPFIAAPINENEFGAFVSLAYNIGPEAFARSTALRRFNAGDRAGAANAMLAWNKAGGKVYEGLKRRRAAERALFLTPADKVMTVEIGQGGGSGGGPRETLNRTPPPITVHDAAPAATAKPPSGGFFMRLLRALFGG